MPTEPVHAKVSLREAVTNAIGYWEPRRLIYNAVLVAIVLWYLVRSLPASRAVIGFNLLLVLFVLAVLANLCYCAAYIPDVVAQFSGFRPVWLRYRSLVLVIGILFAGIIARFFTLALVG